MEENIDQPHQTGTTEPSPSPRITERRTPAWMPVALLALSLIAPILISGFSMSVGGWFRRWDKSANDIAYLTLNISFTILQAGNAVLDVFFIREAMAANRRVFMYLAGFSFVISATLTCLIALGGMAYFWH